MWLNLSLKVYENLLFTNIFWQFVTFTGYLDWLMDVAQEVESFVTIVLRC